MVLFLGISILGYFFEDRSVFDLAAGMLSLIVIVHQFKYIVYRKLRLLLLFLMAVLFAMIILLGYRTGLNTVPIRLMVQFSILVLVIRYHISPRYVALLLIIYISYVLYKFFALSTPLRQILPASSENFVGWVSIGIGVFYYVLIYRYRQKIKVLPALLIFGFAIFCIGRSTIAASIVLLLGVLFFRYYYRNLRVKIVLGILTIGLAVFLFQYDAVLDLILAGFRKFGDKGLSLDHRDYIMASYFEKINFSTFFMGVSPDQSPFINYNSNFHNSYLLAHSQFGIFGILVLIMMMIALFRSLKNHFFLGIMLLAISLRIFTDVIAFVGIFDFVIFYCLYLLLSKHSQLSNYYS